MWSGWSRAAKARKRLRRALPELKGVHLPDLKHMHLPELKRLHMPELHAPEIDWGRGRMGSRAAALWPALFAAAGTGAAVWWWNQWARGRAEAEAEEARLAGLAPVHGVSSEQDREGGREGVEAPETIMAHAPSPVGEGSGGTSLSEPVETLPPHVRSALDESLAVQADAGAPKRGG